MAGIETGVFGAVVLLLLVVGALAVLLYLIPVRLWVAAWASGAYAGLFTLIGMRLRRVPPGTIITARTTFLAVIALFLFGGQVLQGLAFTLMVGIISGTYSTVFIASAIAIVLSPKRQAEPPAAAARQKRA